MNRGGKFLVPTTMLALMAGCGQDGKLEIRSTPTPLAEGSKPVPARVAEGRGQLAMGNVGLALTSFRLAIRDDPNSTDALVGMAMCYDQMSRYDLSRRNYEAALALAPGNLEILAAFVGSLQLQGKTDEAIAVRREIAARAVAAAALDAGQISDEADAPLVAVAALPSATSPETAAAKPIQTAATSQSTLPARSWNAPPVSLSAERFEKVHVEAPKGQTGRVEIAQDVAAPVQAPAQPLRSAEMGSAVTMKLPPVRQVREVAVPAAALPARSFTRAEPQLGAVAGSPLPMTVEVAANIASTGLARESDEPLQTPSLAEERGPYLERMSMGEIALITVPRPVWTSTTVALSNRSTTVRFVPLRVANANAVPVKVRLLNAARVNRLAANTRAWLAARGWRGVAIGDASATRSRSLILYPADKRAMAQRLSAQFGFPMAPKSSSPHIVVLLGSDAVRKPPRRSAWA